MADAREIAEEDERKEIKNFVQFLKENAMRDISAYLKRQMDSWKSTAYIDHDVNVGVLGSAGVGKSTFINTIRRLRPTDPGAARTGVVQTTIQPMAYEHPQNPHLKFWDLPGCGTQNNLRESYLEMIQQIGLDFYIIVCCSRFTEYDLWFAREMRKAGKRFYFVRTKTDIDIRNYRQDYPSIQTIDVLRKVKYDCTSNLLNAELKNIFVYLVCKNPMLYEFSELEEKLINDLPELTRHALLLSLPNTSTKIIMEKAAKLQKKSWLAAAASVAVTEVTGPEMPSKADTGILYGEIMFYKKVFGLDDEGLKQLSKSARVPEQILVGVIRENFWTNLSADSLLKDIGSWIAKRSAADGTKNKKYSAEGFATSMPTPIEDFIVSRLSSFATLNEFLRHLIGSMEKAMLDVLSIAGSYVQESDLE